MELQGTSLLGFGRGSGAGRWFNGMNPINGESLAPRFEAASSEDLERATTLAANAAPEYASVSGKTKAGFLRTIAEKLEANRAVIVQRAHAETALPLGRLEGEVGRTAGQLRMFADVVEEGSWCMARIDTVLPDRKPLPRPDIRSMLRPLGPVAVFGASNFPLAFSVAGGDTASALAAGNPVIVKAHAAHPGTSELVGLILQESVQSCGLPDGVFSLLFDDGVSIGQTLVQHPAIRAVGFTGSLAAGRALMQLAGNRPDPIPCYAEMSSVNPVFILPGALAERADQIAEGLFNSFTLGAGQFCTKPGLVFLPAVSEADKLLARLREKVITATPFSMLTAGIGKNYRERKEQLATAEATQHHAASVTGDASASAALFEISAKQFASDHRFAEEVFGPAAVVIHCETPEQALAAAQSLTGQLTASLFATDEDLKNNAALLAILERKVGCLICNGFPTGVEVCHAMVHGGPYPATSDGRSTSVGSQAIFRFARPVCFQQFPQAALPKELQDANSLGLLRMVNGEMTRAAL